jgi:hypothetical protein
MDMTRSRRIVSIIDACFSDPGMPDSIMKNKAAANKTARIADASYDKIWKPSLK